MCSLWSSSTWTCDEGRDEVRCVKFRTLVESTDGADNRVLTPPSSSSSSPSPLLLLQPPTSSIHIYIGLVAMATTATTHSISCCPSLTFIFRGGACNAVMVDRTTTCSDWINIHVGHFFAWTPFLTPLSSFCPGLCPGPFWILTCKKDWRSS